MRCVSQIVGGLVLGAFAICSGCTGPTAAEKVETVLSEYAAKYPETSEESAIKIEDLSDREAVVKEIRRSRSAWAKTMDPYVKRIADTKGRTAAALAEISREDRRKLWNITYDENLDKNKKLREYGRLGQRISLATYSLEKMGPRGVAALASLLKDSSMFTNVGLSLGILGQKELLLKYFRDKNSTDVERINSAMGLTFCYGETEPVPFLVNFVIEHEQEEQQRKDFRWSQALLASIALEPVSKEAVRYLLEKIEKDGVTKLPAPYFLFMKKHGLDLQKAVRICPWGKGCEGALFVYPTSPMPEEKVKKFLAGLKAGDNSKLDLVIEVGRRVKYKALDKLMTLCEEAGMYEIKIGAHELALGFQICFMLDTLSFTLAKPMDKPATTFQTLFIDVAPLPARSGKKYENRCALKVWFGGYYPEKPEREFELIQDSGWYVTLEPEGMEEFRKFLRPARDNFRLTKSFKSLPVVLMFSPESRMDMVLSIAYYVDRQYGIEDINFLRHTRGCDWLKPFEEHSKIVEKLKELRKKLPLLKELPKDKRESFCSRVAEKWGTDEETALKDLTLLLQHENWEVRGLAEDLLAKIGEPAIPHLLGAFKHHDTYVREYAAFALVEIGKPAIPPLVEALRDKSPRVRASAARTLSFLAQYGHKELLEPLISALKDSDSSVRYEASVGLRYLSDRKAVKPLLELLKDSSKYCRENAAEALKRITGQNFSEDYEKWQQWHEKNRDK